MAVRDSVAGLRDSLDRDGCAYGRVSRERTDNVVDRLDGVETKINWLLASVSVQLVGFLLGVVLFLLNHVRIG